MKKSIIWASFEALITPLLMIIFTPLALRTMGDENYGIWIFFNVISSFFAIFNFGFGDLILRYGAEYRGKGEVDKLLNHNNTIFSLALFLLGIFFLIFLIFVICFSDSISLITIPKSFLNVKAFYVVNILISLLRVVENIILSVYKSQERFKESSIFSVISKSMILIIQVFIYIKYKSLEDAFLISLIGLFIVLIIEYKFSKLKFVKLSFDEIKFKYHEFKKFSFYSWLLSINGIFYGHFDKIIVAKYIGLKELAFYSIAQTVTQQLHLLFATSFQVIIPRVSYLVGAKAPVKKIMIDYWKMLLGLFALASAVYFFNDMFVFKIWLGEIKFSDAKKYLIQFYFYELVLVLNIIPYYFLIAIKRNEINACLSIGMSILTFVTIYLEGSNSANMMISIRTFWAFVFSFLFLGAFWMNIKNEK